MTISRPTDDEVAAALAAIACALATSDEESVEIRTANWQWAESDILITQGTQPTRMPVRPTWGNIERLRRIGRGMKGIIGL